MGERTPNKSQHRPEEENSLAAPSGLRTRNLSITSPALLPTSYPDPYLTLENSVIHIAVICGSKQIVFRVFYLTNWP